MCLVFSRLCEIVDLGFSYSLSDQLREAVCSGGGRVILGDDSQKYMEKGRTYFLQLDICNLDKWLNVLKADV